MHAQSPQNTPLVLVADMQPHMAMALDHMAREAGAAQVALASNSAEAVEYAIDQRPALAILDADLMPVDGYDLAHTIREYWNSKNHQGEIWLTTGRLDEQDAELLTHSTADRVIRHPYDPNMIADLMRHVLAQYAPGSAPTV